MPQSDKELIEQIDAFSKKALPINLIANTYKTKGLVETDEAYNNSIFKFFKYKEIDAVDEATYIDAAYEVLLGARIRLIIRSNRDLYLLGCDDETIISLSQLIQAEIWFKQMVPKEKTLNLNNFFISQSLYTTLRHQADEIKQLNDLGVERIVAVSKKILTNTYLTGNDQPLPEDFSLPVPLIQSILNALKYTGQMVAGIEDSMLDLFIQAAIFQAKINPMNFFDGGALKLKPKPNNFFGRVFMSSPKETTPGFAMAGSAMDDESMHPEDSGQAREEDPFSFMFTRG